MRWIYLVALAACQQQPPPPPAAKPPPPRAPAASVAIHMERTMCYGNCPAYTVDIAPTGAVTFDGHDYTAVKGKFVSWIPPERVAALGQVVQAAQFFALHDYVSGSDCTTIATDSPSARITVVMGGKTKSVEHYHGCYGAPGELFALESAIDLLAGTAPWIGARE